jgi:proline dehydrogenase
VRGAYIVQERARAREQGYKDPIFSNISETHANYHVCLDTILKNIAQAEVGPLSTAATTVVVAHSVCRRR